MLVPGCLGSGVRVIWRSPGVTVALMLPSVPYYPYTLRMSRGGLTVAWYPLIHMDAVALVWPDDTYWRCSRHTVANA